MLAAGLARFGTGFHRLVLAGLTDSVEFERGGFWRRALALLADAIIVTVILQLLAFALYPLSNGRVQFVSGVAMLHCDKLDAVPKGVTVPADFDATSITDCRHTLFGLTSARIVTVARATQNGAITTTKFISHSLDAQGKPIVGPTLDGLIWILLLAMRSAFDRGSRGTPARRLCRVRLSNAADGQSPPPAPTVTRRYAVLTLPLLPLLIWSLMLQPIMCAEAVASIWLTLGMILPAVVLLGAVGLAVVAIIQRRDTWYDRFAGTSVLALDRDHAIIPAVVTPPPLQPESGPALPALPEPAMADAAGAEFAPQALPPPLPKPPSANYLVRHWRGELSLPKSYWLNGFLGGLAIGVAIVALTPRCTWIAYATASSSRHTISFAQPLKQVPRRPIASSLFWRRREISQWKGLPIHPSKESGFESVAELKGTSMSLSKRILFGDDPADDAARAALRERARRLIELFTFRIPTRRRNRLGIGPYWDPNWPGCVYRAAKELKVEHITINSHVCTQTQADADSIVTQAEVLYKASVESALKMAAEITGRSIESFRSGRRQERCLS
jgi:hypothetical protein